MPMAYQNTQIDRGPPALIAAHQLPLIIFNQQFCTKKLILNIIIQFHRKQLIPVDYSSVVCRISYLSINNQILCPLRHPLFTAYIVASVKNKNSGASVPVPSSHTAILPRKTCSSMVILGKNLMTQVNGNQNDKHNSQMRALSLTLVRKHAYSAHTLL